MKIGIVCYPTHGGSGVVASELAVGLAERGHEVHIVSYTTPFRLRKFHENVLIHEVEVLSYPLFKYPPYALSLATKLVSLTKEYGLELIHAHYAVPHAASAFLAKKMLGSQGLKTITTLHGTDITLIGLDPSFYEVIKFNIEESDGVTAVSHYLQQRTIDELAIQRNIRVIHNFVDTSRYNPSITSCTKEHYAPNGEKILIHASNFRPLKKTSDVVQIFNLVRQEIPAKLLLVGEGPDRISTQRLVKSLGLSEDVFFLGEQDYLENLMNCADLFILPSEQESFGLVALEAQASGLPVVGTAVGGLPEVVVHEQTGLLFPVGEINEMAHGALELLKNPSRYDSFRKSARQRAVKHFDSKLIIPQYESFYQEILNSS